MKTPRVAKLLTQFRPAVVMVANDKYGERVADACARLSDLQERVVSDDWLILLRASTWDSVKADAAENKYAFYQKWVDGVESRYVVKASHDPEWLELHPKK